MLPRCFPSLVSIQLCISHHPLSFDPIVEWIYHIIHRHGSCPRSIGSDFSDIRLNLGIKFLFKKRVFSTPEEIGRNSAHKCFAWVMLSRPIPLEPEDEDTGKEPLRPFEDKSSHVICCKSPRLPGMGPVNLFPFNPLQDNHQQSRMSQYMIWTKIGEKLKNEFRMVSELNTLKPEKEMIEGFSSDRELTRKWGFSDCPLH